MTPETNQRFAETTNALTDAPKTVVNADKEVEPEAENLLHRGATLRNTYAPSDSEQTTTYPDHKDSLEFNSIDSPLALISYSQRHTTGNTLAAVASGQRRKGRKSMSRRSGQRGQVVKKGCMWHVRYYVDAPGQEKRQRKSVPIGPCAGKDKLTKPEAVRKGAEVVASLGVNTADHLERSMNLKPIVVQRRR